MAILRRYQSKYPEGFERQNGRVRFRGRSILAARALWQADVANPASPIDRNGGRVIHGYAINALLSAQACLLNGTHSHAKSVTFMTSANHSPLNMSEPVLIETGAGAARAAIAVRKRPATKPGAGPGLLWLGGFHSDMKGTKAQALDEWAAEQGRACTRFDLSAMANPADVSRTARLRAGWTTALPCSMRFATGRTFSSAPQWADGSRCCWRAL